ncbi:MAG: type II toxin-antitoxin system VapC family toxin [SAR324 cluster bacterium]|nr:type II toxin-antitoxin system VapC family toxin [SAR324 cluster bacterium]
MVIDTSAIIAILLGEPEGMPLSHSIVQDNKRIISSFSVLESSIVIEAKKGPSGKKELDLLLHRIMAEIIPFNIDQMEIARIAWSKFGKGRHPASLNIGDCCSYALSKYSGEALLFKGEDFSKTDLVVVRY